MRKLLSAYFVRLKKDKVFWLSMAFMFGFGLYAMTRRYMSSPSMAPDQMFLVFPILCAVISPVFCSLYIGTEYSDGAMRNKLVIGHTRTNIYLSTLIVSAAAGIFMSLVYLVAVTAMGLPLFGGVQMDMRFFMMLMLTAFGIVITYAAILTMLCLSIQSKAHASVVSILAILGLFVIASMIYGRLEEPEFITEFILTGISDVGDFEKIPNPKYLTGMAREVYQFFLDFLPTGQALQLSGMTARNVLGMPLYSLIITIATTGIGLFIFQKKDIK